MAAGPRSCVVEQLQAKTDVVRAMHERVQLRWVNHTFRVPGHAVLGETEAAKTFSEVGRRSVGRLFLGLTEDSMEQASLSAGGGKRLQTRCGCGSPGTLGALIACKPWIVDMIQQAELGGLLSRQPLEERFEASIAAVATAFVDTLDDSEGTTAELYLQPDSASSQAASLDSDTCRSCARWQPGTDPVRVVPVRRRFRLSCLDCWIAPGCAV